MFFVFLVVELFFCFFLFVVLSALMRAAVSGRSVSCRLIHICFCIVLIFMWSV